MPSTRRRVILCLAAFAILAMAAAGCDSGSNYTPPPEFNPQAALYEVIGPFGNGLAPVRLNGSWGYIDKTGKVAIPIRFDSATPFAEGYAVVWTQGRWRLLNNAGRLVNLPQVFSRLGKFLDGLAPAKDPATDSWGFIDSTGRFVIGPQFEKVDAFSNGLAPVKKEGKWSYVGPGGGMELETDFHRAYPFGEEDLALVQPDRDGLYSYMDSLGRLRIEGFVQAQGFSEGLAAARRNTRWGYVNADGDWAVLPKYQAAFPFKGGVALVMENGGYHYIDSKGQPLFGGYFEKAEPMSEDVAVVGNGRTFWYVDRSGKLLDIGHATAVMQDSSGCTPDEATWGVKSQYKGGLVNYRIVNLTRTEFTLTPEQDDAGYYHPAVPGYPERILPFTDGSTQGVHGFLLKYYSGIYAQGGTGTYHMFSMNIEGDDLVVKLDHTLDYTKTAIVKKDHPWWDYIKAALDIVKGVVELDVGDDPDEAAKSLLKGYYEISKGSYDICNGATDGEDDDNATSKNTDNILVTGINGTYKGQPLNSVNGTRCGGDTFTVSDGKEYVIELTVTQTDSMPPTLSVIIHTWNEYFAENAMANLERFRSDQNQSYAGYPYDCIYKLVYDDCDDLKNTDSCIGPPGFPKYSYYGAVNGLSPIRALDWWSFTNYFDNNMVRAPENLYEMAQWMETFSGRCGAADNSCPPTMSLSQTSFNAAGPVGGTATWTVNVMNAHPEQGALAIWAEPDEVIDSANGNPPCHCEEGNTDPINCSLRISVPYGTEVQNAYITDGFAKIPITISAQIKAMSLPQTEFNCASFGPTCSYSVSVNDPAGPVTAASAVQPPANIQVTDNTCTGAMDSCSFTLTVPALANGNVNVSDGRTTLPLRYSTTAPAMSLPQTEFSSKDSVSGSCSFNYVVNNPWGPVAVDSNSPSQITNNTCNGPMAGECGFTLTVPTATGDRYYNVDDGHTVVATTVDCEARPNMSLDATEYGGICQPGQECSFTVKVNNAWGQVTMDNPAFGIANNTCTGIMDSCTFTMSLPPGNQGAGVSDGHTTVHITADCDDNPAQFKLDQTNFAGSSLFGQPCSFGFIAQNPRGPVTIDNPALIVTKNTCTGPTQSCEVDFTAPVGQNQTANVSDGSSSVQITTGCSRTPD